METIERVPTKLRESLRRLQGLEATEQDGLSLISRLTFLMLIQNSGLAGVPFYVVLAVSVVGFAAPGWYRLPWIWLPIAGAMIWGHAPRWYSIDNHQFLMSYWCIALFLSTLLDESEKARSVASNARWLIFFCFAFATLWKVWSPDYLNGSFFTITLLKDGRFFPLTTGITEVTQQQLMGFLHELARLSNPAGGVSSAAIPEVGARFSTVALAMTWVTILIEGVIALLFLWPWRTRPARLRHGALLLFAAGVYSLATVRGFGMLLMVMGLAQCEQDRRKTRLLYIGCFALVFLYPTLKSIALS